MSGADPLESEYARDDDVTTSGAFALALRQPAVAGADGPPSRADAESTLRSLASDLWGGSRTGRRRARPRTEAGGTALGATQSRRSPSRNATEARRLAQSAGTGKRRSG